MYVDAIIDKSDIRIVERIDGKRKFVNYKPEYYFYANDKNGKYETIYGNKVSKIKCKNKAEFDITRNTYPANKVWESDINPIFRCIESNYKNSESPNLNIAFFDIEVDFDRELGYASPDNPINKIISIAIYFKWLRKSICIAIPPPTMTIDQAQEISDKVNGNTLLFDSESDMLSTFLDLIEDADVISGWYSSGFDIPYTINRIHRVLGKQEDRRMCLWNMRPKSKEIISHGNKIKTYDLVGRVHLDYMELYKKYTFEERHSYSLDYICNLELGESKVPYDGTLDDLYKKDFKLFLEYNIQDTDLVYKLDQKFEYIDLTNNLAHSNHVLMENTLGTVAMTDNAIVIEAHENNKIVPDKKKINEREENDIINKAAGGWVSRPKSGLHKLIGSVDLNSLYPSTIRSFNMSPETIIGQIRLDLTHKELLNYLKTKGHTFSEWWNDRFNILEMEYFYNDDNGNLLTIDFEDGSSQKMTGKELRTLIFDSDLNWHITANGTIFTTDKEGIVPQILTRWYSERKVMQKKNKEIKKLVNGYNISELIE